MYIEQIYEHFNTPPNLQEHMIRVAKIVIFIRDKWTGPEVNWKSLLTAALLHDMGNIVRFNFDGDPSMYGQEAKRLDYWREKQKEMITKYGSDDHDATRNMLKEVGVDLKIVDTVLSKSFANAEKIRDSNNWLNKILLYADMRVLPDGVGTLKERLDELKSRRTDLQNNPSIENRFKACEDLEDQIQNELSVPVSAITDESVKNINLQIDTIKL